jgi:hypothetical protein
VRISGILLRNAMAAAAVKKIYNRTKCTAMWINNTAYSHLYKMYSHFSPS